MSNGKPFRYATDEELRILAHYARLEISLEELKKHLAGMLEFHFDCPERRLTSYFLPPKEPIRIEVKHIRNAMEKHARAEIKTRELAEWATMLLLNEAYDWEGIDEDEIADWLNEISMLVLNPSE